MIFPSRRNLVRTVEFNGTTAVRKLFDNPADWHAELRMYGLLAGKASLPKLLGSVPGVLLMEYLAFPTLLDELERQEREGFSENPWLALRSLLTAVHTAAGYCPADGNLRNFLWDGADIHGVDLEGYAPAPLGESLARIAAYILEYAPRDTAVKRRAAHILYPGNTDRAQQELLARRMRKRPEKDKASFILLAGGKSSRMGSDKASLPLLGATLLEHQLDKARLMGCGDVLVSGARAPAAGARIVPDIYPDRGPLGGLHACMQAAKHPRCIVLSVDMPLLPPCELRALLEDHLLCGSEITLAEHFGKWEPLAGVYNTELSGRIAPLIEVSGAPVRALIKNSACRFRQTQLPDLYFSNCNTPEEWQSLFGG